MVSPKDTCNNTDLKRISFNAVFIYTTSVTIDQKLTIHVDIDIAQLKFSANFQPWTTLFDDDKAYKRITSVFFDDACDCHVVLSSQSTWNYGRLTWTDMYFILNTLPSNLLLWICRRIPLTFGVIPRGLFVRVGGIDHGHQSHAQIHSEKIHHTKTRTGQGC